MIKKKLQSVDFKKLLVIYYFLSNGNEPSFAAKIEKELPDIGIINASITRRWARIVCEKLIVEGILNFHTGKVWRQREPVKYYKLIENLETLRLIARIIIPRYGSLLVHSNYAQSIIENELISDLENHYKTEFDEEDKESILTILFISPKAVELALNYPILPEFDSKTKKGRIRKINQFLLGLFSAALITDLSQKSFDWSKRPIDSIGLQISVNLKAGDVEATIESELKFNNPDKPKIVDMLKAK